MKLKKWSGSRFRVFVMICAALILTGALEADTIYLRNGRVIEGTLVGQTRYTVRIRVGNRIRSYRKRGIKRISYGLDRSEQRRRAAAKRRLEAKRKRLARLRRLAREREARKRDEAERKREAARIARLEAQVKRDEEGKRKREEARLNLIAEMRRSLADKEQAVRDQEKRLEDARKRIAAEKERLRRQRELMARREAEQRRIERMRNATPENALWRSAILPGWGQLYRGGEWKAYGFMGAGIALLGAAAATSLSAASTRSGYESDPLRFVGFIGTSALGLDAATNTTLAAFALSNRANQLSSAQSAASTARTASLLFAGFYIYNLIDAYLFRPAIPRAMDTVTARSDAGRGSFFFSLRPEAGRNQPFPKRAESIRAGFQMRF